MQRHVTVEGVRLRFAAAHMATLGDQLEPLHGHNYGVRCRVEGSLSTDGWVIDFSVLKRYVREVCEQLDHKFLLQRDSGLLQIDEHPDGWTLSLGNRQYHFPCSDVAVLSIENTTAELIAQWITTRIRDALVIDKRHNIERVSVDIEEMPGQSGGCTLDINPNHTHT